MNDTNPTSPTGRRSAILRTVVEYAVVEVALAAGLTLFMADTNWSIRSYGLTFLANLAFAVGIATTTGLLFDQIVTRFFEPGSRWRWAAFPLALAVGLAVGTEIGVWMLELLMGDQVRFSRFGVYRVGALVSAAVITASVVYDRLKNRARVVELDAERARRELLEARVENIDARLNPHFLFNCLNTIAALIEEDPRVAVEAVERLSDLLRYGLAGTKEPEAPLEREFQAIQDYLELEHLRFGDRLRWTLDLPAALTRAMVPSLVLQPLVENAVKHGISGTADGGTVRVWACLEGDQMRVVVDDDGSGSSETGGNKIGEASVRERLEISYGVRASFRAGYRASGGYRADIRLPYMPPKDTPCA